MHLKINKKSLNRKVSDMSTVEHFDYDKTQRFINRAKKLNVSRRFNEVFDLDGSFFIKSNDLPVPHESEIVTKVKKNRLLHRVLPIGMIPLSSGSTMLVLGASQDDSECAIPLR